jgi:hypothetical protein
VHQPSEVWLSPTGSINLGFTTEGKLAAMLIIPSSWGSQRGVIYTPSVADALGVAGEQGTIGGRRDCDVIKLLKAAPAMTSVLSSLTSSRSFIASWA